MTTCLHSLWLHQMTYPPQLGPTDLPGDFTLSGFRVPIIVISPFVKPNFVSHTNRELTSILKLVETRFNLPPLTRRDAAADDMTEFFDFVNPPAFLTPPIPDQPVIRRKTIPRKKLRRSKLDQT